MRTPLRYTNSLGHSIDFESDGFHTKHESLYGYEWDYIVKQNKVTSFSRGAQVKKITAYIKCWNEAEGLDRRMRLHDITEEDVLRKTPGKLIVGEYYCSAFVVASEKKNSHYTGKIMQADLSLLLPEAIWYRDIKSSYHAQSGSGASDCLNTPFNCSFNLAASSVVRTTSNESLHPENFRIEIHGFVENPYVRIGGNSYAVNVTVNIGEVLIIDTRDKTVTLILRDGTESNVYDLSEYGAEGSGLYIFEKIKPGKHAVTWPMTFGFEMTTYLTRSEPPPCLT